MVLVWELSTAVPEQINNIPYVADHIKTHCQDLDSTGINGWILGSIGSRASTLVPVPHKHKNYIGRVSKIILL